MPEVGRAISVSQADQQMPSQLLHFSCLPGTRATSENGALRWPLSRHGICGDPFAGERKHEYGGVSATGTITGNYTEGDNINITIVINTSHKGRFSFRICVIWNPSLELTELTEDCLNEHILVRAEFGGGEWEGWTGITAVRAEPGCKKRPVFFHSSS